MSKERETIKSTKRWVIKIGSALITDNGCGLKHDNLDNWVNQISTLRERGIDIVIVSSGAVAEGLTRLNWKNRPNIIHKLQAAAAVGQMGLIQAYETCFQKYNKQTAQVLLTHDDISNRTRYLNARTSLNTLLQLGVVPIVNENDTVATDEIRFGDNDTLAGLVANLIDAELLVLLTDQNGLYTSDPRKDSSAELIEQAKADDESLEKYAGDSSNYGRGGMLTKLKAASIASKSNTQTIIASGNESSILLKIANSEKVGTLLTTSEDTLQAKKQWLANQAYLKGSVTIDSGAVTAIIKSGKSLLPIGVKSITGEFKRGEIISCIDLDGKEIARGLSNYDSIQATSIMGKSSEEIGELLDCKDEDELIHRDNMILI
ncbi:MAG: glutamate 5-kinase [Legionellales bacterium]|jgi:glutamate 5-kinase|nr:glutamate 5-kinase [Legionellales bacterium]|tara:strand:- start:1117 stop:2241 length:1125 start_codon:yes stop_codon:yes gene_type:complete